jgi:hypothetical protein
MMTGAWYAVLSTHRPPRSTRSPARFHGAGCRGAAHPGGCVAEGCSRAEVDADVVGKYHHFYHHLTLRAGRPGYADGGHVFDFTRCGYDPLRYVTSSAALPRWTSTVEVGCSAAILFILGYQGGLGGAGLLRGRRAKGRWRFQAGRLPPTRIDLLRRGERAAVSGSGACGVRIVPNGANHGVAENGSSGRRRSRCLGRGLE